MSFFSKNKKPIGLTDGRELSNFNDYYADYQTQETAFCFQCDRRVTAACSVSDRLKMADYCLCPQCGREIKYTHWRDALVFVNGKEKLVLAYSPWREV